MNLRHIEEEFFSQRPEERAVALDRDAQDLQLWANADDVIFQLSGQRVFAHDLKEKLALKREIEHIRSQQAGLGLLVDLELELMQDELGDKPEPKEPVLEENLPNSSVNPDVNWRRAAKFLASFIARPFHPSEAPIHRLR